MFPHLLREVVEHLDPVTVRVAEVPEGEENSLWEKMQQLRAEGYVVLESGSANGHDFELIFREENWQLVQGEN